MAPCRTDPVGPFDKRAGADLRGITIRAVRAADADRIARAFRALDPASIYQRFFFPKKELSDEEIRRLTACDGVRDVVMVATVVDAGEETLVGLCRYASDGACADIAVMVQEAHRGRGIASELVRQVADIARRNGLSQLEADVLPSNAPMLKVFRRSGLPISEEEAGGIVHVTLLLGNVAEACECRDRASIESCTATERRRFRYHFALPCGYLSTTGIAEPR